MAAPMAAHPDFHRHRPLLSSRPTAGSQKLDGGHTKGRRRPPQRPTAGIPKVDGDHPKGRRRPSQGRRRPSQGPTATIPTADGGYPKGVWVVTSQYTASSHEPVRRSPKPAHEPHIIPYGTCVSSVNRVFALTTTCDPLSIPIYHALIEQKTKAISNTYIPLSQPAHRSGIARMLELPPGRDLLFRFRSVQRRLI